MPKVDVIIPAFNAARFLTAAIDSVKEQTFTDWRIVVVNDGSTDATREIIDLHRSELGDKLTCIEQPNAGLPAARNTAIRSSSSEFLALLDADDVWMPWRLEESLKSFDGKPQTGLSYGMIRYIDEAGNTTSWCDRKQDYAEARIATHIYTRSVYLPCPTITFRRKCIDEVGLFDETMRATEDRDMWLRIALKYEVGFVHRVIAHYRVSANSMSTNPERMLKAQLQFVEKHRREHGCGAWPRRVALGRIYKQYADALSLQGRSQLAFRNSLRAVRFNPLDRDNLRAAGSLFKKRNSGTC